MCRRFTLVREEHDGINQPGVVAEGVVFESGKVALNWLQRPHSIQTFDSIADVIAVQKQNGVTRIAWVDHRDSRPSETSVQRNGMEQLREARAALSGLLGEEHVLVSQASTRSMRLAYAREASGSGEHPIVPVGVQSR